MLSKFCTAAQTALRDLRSNPNWISQRLVHGFQGPSALKPRLHPALRTPARQMSLVPVNQYENNILPKKLQLGHALFHNWEIIPLFCVVAFDILVVLAVSLYMGLTQKVDIQYSKHSWNCISRTMDLRKPTIHKLVVLYQRYEPWPEMQLVLDKMTQAEIHKQTRLDTCNVP